MVHLYGIRNQDDIDVAVDDRGPALERAAADLGLPVRPANGRTLLS